MSDGEEEGGAGSGGARRSARRTTADRGRLSSNAPDQPPGPNKREMEAEAPDWPGAEYRKWVQSQVANRMLLAIGGITIALLITATTIFINVQGAIVKSLVDQTKTTVILELAEPMRAAARTEVINSLVTQADLVAKAEAKVAEDPKGIAERLIAKPDFVEPVMRSVLELLKDDELFRATILQAVGERALDVTASTAARSLAIQLYALLHDGQTFSNAKTVRPLRELFTAAYGEGDTFAGELIDNTVSFYPMAKDDAACTGGTDTCAQKDNEIVDAVLKRLADMQSGQQFSPQYASALKTLRPRALERTLEWIAGDLSRPAVVAVVDLWLSQDDAVLKRNAFNIIEQMLNNTEPQIRRNGLYVCARLPAAMEIPATVRHAFLDAIWSAHYRDDLTRAFSPSLPSDIRMLVAAHAAVRATAIEDTSDMLLPALAIVGLLRAGDAEQANDWNWVVSPGSESRLGNPMPAYARVAWVARMVLDGQLGSVERAAGEVLGTTRPGLYLADAIESATIAAAIPLAGLSDVDSFAKAYEEAGIRAKDTDPLPVAITEALVLRDEERSYAWLTRLGSESEQSMAFRSHVLSIAAGGIDASYLPDVLRGSIEAASDGTPARSILADVLVGEIVAMVNTSKWSAVAAIEDAGFLDQLYSALPNSQNVAMLRGMVPWIGTEVDETGEGRTVVFGSNFTFKGHDGEPQWLRLNVLTPVMVEVTVDPGLELVITDTTRRRIVARVKGPSIEAFGLAAERHAMTLRPTGESEPDAAATLTTSGPAIVANQPSAPFIVSRPFDLPFAGASEGGEIWLMIDEDVSVPVTVSTYALGEDGGLDTFMELVYPFNGSVLLSNDDIEGSTFSQLSLTPDQFRDRLIRITRYPGGELSPTEQFQREDRFGVSVRY